MTLAVSYYIALSIGTVLGFFVGVLFSRQSADERVAELQDALADAVAQIPPPSAEKAWYYRQLLERP